MNGFAALDIHPHRRYVVDMGGRRSCRCRLHINFALFLHSLDFTQNLGVALGLLHHLVFGDPEGSFGHRHRKVVDLDAVELADGYLNGVVMLVAEGDLPILQQDNDLVFSLRRLR